MIRILKRYSFWSLITILVFSAIGCRMFNTQSKVRPEPVRVMKPSSQLLAFFPQTLRTKWIYDGFVEYDHTMEIKSIVRSRNRDRIYHNIIGKVGDPSGGESKRNFNFKIQYLFIGKSVYEYIVKSDTPFPHRILKLKLLSLPLKKGYQWSQTVAVDSKKVTLNAKIIAIEQKNIFNKPTETVTVRYRMPMKGMPGGTYEEVRVFALGIGVYSFEKTFGPNQTDRFGYTLRDIVKPPKN